MVRSFLEFVEDLATPDSNSDPYEMILITLSFPPLVWRILVINLNLFEAISNCFFGEFNNWIAQKN